MKPLLAHIYSPNRWQYGPAWVQPKLNGVRALYQMGQFQSRDELPWNPNVLKHLSDVLKDIFSDHYILDGELYVHGWKLQAINGAVAINRTAPCDKTPLVEYHIFDTVMFDVPFWERWEQLRPKVPLLSNTKIKLVPTQKIVRPEQADDFYASFVAAGYEGIMYRLGNCPYTKPKQPKDFDKGFLSDKNNRSWHLLKRKDWQDDEFECVDVEEGVGKRSGMVGAFVCTVNENVRFCVGSGLSDAEATHYLQNPPIGRKIKVKFLTYTADGKPFNPTVEAIL